MTHSFAAAHHLKLRRGNSLRALSLAREQKTPERKELPAAKPLPSPTNLQCPQLLWNTVRLAVKAGLLHSNLMRSRARQMTKTWRTPKRTLLEVKSKGVLNATPLWQQGNEAFYSPDQVEARFRLRTSPEVQGALHNWWSATLRSLQSGGDESACTVGHDRYVSLYMAIYRQLVPGRVTSSAYQSDARCSAEADWSRDSKGRCALERGELLDGLFELADLYVPTVEVQDYADFLDNLLRAVSISRGSEPLQLWVEKPKQSGLRLSASSAALPPSPSKARLLPPKTPPQSPLPPPSRLSTPVKRPLTPTSPLTPGRKLIHTPSTSKRRLHPSNLRYSHEHDWLATSVGLPPHLLPPSPGSKKVLPAIGSIAVSSLEPPLRSSVSSDRDQILDSPSRVLCAPLVQPKFRTV